MYQIDPRTSGKELRLEPRPDDRNDRTANVLTWPTRQANTDGRARIKFEREESESDRSFSLLACLVRTACTDGRTDGLTGEFDQYMKFDHLNFSKARILKLSDDLARIWTHSVHEGHPADRTARPTCVLLLTAMHTSGLDEPGQ